MTQFTNFEIKRVLIIRFRQIGDALLSTVICNILRKNFPQAQIDMILNSDIAPLFEKHPSIDHIWTFTTKEQHSLLKYLPKVYHIMHNAHYDVIIDMRSTMKTMPFALFSLPTAFRIGIKKTYNIGIYNYRINDFNIQEDVIKTNKRFLMPLYKIKELNECCFFSLGITDEEVYKFRTYMESQGIDFKKPIILIGITARLLCKTYRKDNMTKILRKFIECFPKWQIIFNYAGEKEEKNAREMYKQLNCDKHIFINIKAKNLRQLAAMSKNVSFYFGNEGGARHIAHAMGVPSYSICCPTSDKRRWLPQNEIPTKGIGATDFLTEEQRTNMSIEELYNLIKPEYVWQGLEAMILNVKTA